MYANSFMRYTYKTLRITAWLLLVITPLVLFSGLSMTKRSLSSWSNYEALYYIHTVTVSILFVPLFYLHSLCGILTLVSRNEFWNRKPLKMLAGIIWTFVFVVFILFYTLGNSVQDLVAGQYQESSQNIEERGSGMSYVPPKSVLLDISEISKHNTQQDCWIIVNSRVYDVTEYLEYHPGGPETIIPYCGKDATYAFQVDKPHSSKAASLLNSLYVGDVDLKSAAKKYER